MATDFEAQVEAIMQANEASERAVQAQEKPLGIAAGFTAGQYIVQEHWQPFTVSEDWLSQEDVARLTDNPYSRSLSRWAFSYAEKERPLVLNEVPLDVRIVGPMMMRLFVSEAVLSFRLEAEYVMPVRALGRIVVVQYQTAKEKHGKPVPLLSMLDLTARASVMHDDAIRTFLQGNAGKITDAIRVVLRAGVGKMAREEAFFYVLEMLSLVTGAYRIRYDTAGVESKS